MDAQADRPDPFDPDEEPGIFEAEDPEAIAASDVRARADYAAGRYATNEDVIAWLRTWGEPGRKPFPRKWRR